MMIFGSNESQRCFLHRAQGFLAGTPINKYLEEKFPRKEGDDLNILLRNSPAILGIQNLAKLYLKNLNQSTPKSQREANAILHLQRLFDVNSLDQTLGHPLKQSTHVDDEGIFTSVLTGPDKTVVSSTLPPNV